MFDRTRAWLRGGAGAMKDRRLKRTGRGTDDAAAIDESLASCDCNPPLEACAVCGTPREGDAIDESLEQQPEPLYCCVCGARFVGLTGGVQGCPCHGIREGLTFDEYAAHEGRVYHESNAEYAARKQREAKPSAHEGTVPRSRVRDAVRAVNAKDTTREDYLGSKPLPEGWKEGTAEELLGLEPGELDEEEEA